MATRQELYGLIDSLPDGAIDAAYGALSTFRACPVVPRDMDAMLKHLDERRAEMQKRVEERTKRPGTISGFGGSGSYNPLTGSGSHSFSYWDADGFVVQTYRQHQGHDMMVTEHIRIHDQQLIYKHEITGPGEKHDEREISFDIP